MLKKILITMIAFFGVAIAAQALASHNPNHHAANIQVKQARVELARMGPQGQANPAAKQMSTEAKVDIINRGNTTLKLVAAHSEIAQQVQLHQFVTVNGKEVMQKIDSITIRPDSEIDLSFQGIHIMLIGLNHPLKIGHKVPLTLIFSDGSYVHVNAKVVKS